MMKTLGRESHRRVPLLPRSRAVPILPIPESIACAPVAVVMGGLPCTPRSLPASIIHRTMPQPFDGVHTPASPASRSREALA